MSINQQIIKELDMYDKQKLYVVINGEYWEHHYSVNNNGYVSSRTASVYAKVTQHKQYDEATEKYVSIRIVNFCYVTSDRSEVIINNGFDELDKRLNKQIFGNLDLPRSGRVFINAQPDLGIIFINSDLYDLASRCATLPDDQVMVVNGNALSRDVQKKLQYEFDKYQFGIYRDLVYGASGHSRFVKKFFTRDNIYKVQSAFVPVFIDINFLYNPLLSDKYKIKDTKMYKMAVEKNRFIQFGTFASCYLLTHKEICEALGMHNFVRFTSDLWYKLVVGLLMTSLEGFPHKNGETYCVIDKDLVANTELKSRYKMSDYLAVVKKNIEMRDAATDKKEKAVYLTNIGLLEQYKKDVNSLYLTCMDSISRISNYGAHVLDIRSEVTASKLYDYLNMAFLL